jgi:signal transduction histidine kinase
VHEEIRVIQGDRMSPSKRDEKLLAAERLEVAGKLASEIAHELNTPLGGILMYSHLLLEDVPEDDPSRENIVKINKLAHRCKIIVQGLLDFAKRDVSPEKRVQVNRLLRDVIGFLEDHVLLKRISIETDLDPDLPEVIAHENKLEQVFINLIVNAAQSMDGHGILMLRTKFVRDTGGILIQFSDTGCGIDEKDLDRIFDPFFTTKARGKGTGLGLSICHGIIEQQGGTITANSVKGKGSMFTVFLPVDRPAAPVVSGGAGSPEGVE